MYLLHCVLYCSQGCLHLGQHSTALYTTHKNRILILLWKKCKAHGRQKSNVTLAFARLVLIVPNTNLTSEKNKNFPKLCNRTHINFQLCKPRKQNLSIGWAWTLNATNFLNSNLCTVFGSCNLSKNLTSGGLRHLCSGWMFLVTLVLAESESYIDRLQSFIAWWCKPPPEGRGSVVFIHRWTCNLRFLFQPL